MPKRAVAFQLKALQAFDRFRLRGLAARVEESPRRFAVAVSNVVGPREPVAVLGAPARRLYSLAEIGERHALRVGAVSLAGGLNLGLCADPGIVDDRTCFFSSTATSTPRFFFHTSASRLPVSAPT